MRIQFYIVSVLLFSLTWALGYWFTNINYFFIVLIPFFLLGLRDILQNKQAIRKNFPVLGNFRYLLEVIRPEIQQYFIETNTDGKPFSREMRSVVYQRAKNVTDTVPFGTQLDLYQNGAEWVAHSMMPKHPPADASRILVGEGKNAYNASRFNISAMSYGSLSLNAIQALNKGAKLGGFYHNTGEGGLSDYHLMHGGDVTWQIGTGYFGCRDKNGNFDAGLFQEKSRLPNVRMIEIKLSQGAKPSHGGLLPAAKITEEIARIRNVPMGKDCVSPPAHTTFNSPTGLLEFVQKLRTLSDGKPIGFKFCLGQPREFLSICKAMVKTGILPDFITVDGAEGGTGAAPVEFTNSIGFPLADALVFVQNALTGVGLRKKIRVIASGKVITGFHILQKIALGADMCNSARGMLFALGCIQALRCNTNNCPTGVATQDPDLYKGLDIGDKSVRVANFHKITIKNFLEVVGAAGLESPSEIKPRHVYRRTSSFESKSYAELFTFLKEGELLDTDTPRLYRKDWEKADPAVF